MTELSLDYETKSKIDLLGEGLYPYARDPSTRVLMAAYAIDDGPVQLWQPHLQPKAPADLRDALRDPSVKKWAWNAPFEDAITEHTLKLPVMNWRDTMVQALYASLPGALALAGPALGLPEELCKDPEGKRLIRLFCVPKKDGAFNDWESHPEDWEKFCSYCCRDVTTERMIRRKLATLPVPEAEWELWNLDQEINRRGVPVDLRFVEQAIKMGAVEKERLVRLLKRDTGLSNPMTQANFLKWARDNGYPYNDLRKATVERAIREGGLDEKLVEMLRIRSQAAKTSMAKFNSIQEKTRGGRVYNMLQFYGAARTGRWGGRDPQPHNFARPEGYIEGREEEVTAMVREGEYDDILMEFGNAIPVISSVTRSSFAAPEGKTFYIADLNAIENRVLGWLAGCDAILDVFRNDRCPYISFAVQMLGRTYEDLWHEYTVLKLKKNRTDAKPAVLGGGYMLGGGEEKVNKQGDLVRTGLWGYAEAMGIKMTKEQAHESVRVFRDAHPEVVQFWRDLRDAAMECVRNHTTIRVGHVVFNGSKGLMRVRLPNGRCLHYIRPRIDKVKRVFEKKVIDHYDDNGKPVHKIVKETKIVDALSYEGTNQTTKKWERQYTHPGKITENLVQAVARDVLCEGLKNAKAKGFDIVLHVHDEIICEVPLDSHLTLDDLIECMSRDISWAPGLPLAAAGEVSPFYKK